MNSHYTKLINNNCAKCFAPINSNNCCQTISMRKQIEALKVQLQKLDTQTSPGKIATLEKSISLIETTLSNLSNLSNRNDDNILNLKNRISTIEVNLLNLNTENIDSQTKDDISILKTTIKIINEKLSELEKQSKSHTEIDIIKQKIDDIEVKLSTYQNIFNNDNILELNNVKQSLQDIKDKLSTLDIQNETHSILTLTEKLNDIEVKLYDLDTTKNITLEKIGNIEEKVKNVNFEQISNFGEKLDDDKQQLIELKQQIKILDEHLKTTKYILYNITLNKLLL
jgi:hypothetical protein